MTTYTFNCPKTGEVWQRVHATKAKKLFAKGVELRGIPCKMALFGVWSSGGHTILLDKDNVVCPNYQFYQIERNIWAYNCCSQLGYAVAYYVLEKELKKCK